MRKSGKRYTLRVKAKCPFCNREILVEYPLPEVVKCGRCGKRIVEGTVEYSILHEEVVGKITRLLAELMELEGR